MLEEEIVETKQAKAMRDAKGKGGGTRSKAGLRKMPTEAKNLLPKTAVGDLYHEKVPTSKRPIEDFVLFEVLPAALGCRSSCRQLLLLLALLLVLH